MHPVLFNLFGLKDIHTFGVMVLLGVIAGLLWIRHDAPRLKIEPEDSTSLAVDVFLAGLIGSRALFVAMNWEKNYAGHALDALKVWEGGLVWYGGFIAALPAAYWRMRSYKMPVLRACDLLAPSTMLGLGVGRIGCLMAGDDHGRLVVELSKKEQFFRDNPWALDHHIYWVDKLPWYTLTFTDKQALVTRDAYGQWSYLGHPLLPSQPLMTLGCFTIFLILVALRRRLVWAPGALTALLFVLYPIERYFIEMTRGDSIRGFLADSIPIVGGMSTSQAISVGMLPAGLVLLAVALRAGQARAARLVAEGKDPCEVEGPPPAPPAGASPPAASETPPAPPASAPASAPAASAPAASEAPPGPTASEAGPTAAAPAAPGGNGA